MCGIAGYVGPRRRSTRERIDAALGSCATGAPTTAPHRTFETADGRHVALLHTRLTIIDLDERSNQPYRVGGTWLGYNGELYNYLEVRERPRARRARRSRTRVGHRGAAAPRSTADGWEALDALRGHVGVRGLRRGRRQLVALCRDRFGEKPLYLLPRRRRRSYFGSELKFLVALAGPARSPVEPATTCAATSSTATRRSTRAATRSSRALEELRPRHRAARSGAAASDARRYWDAAPRRRASGMSFDEAVAGTRERLIRSVELRLRADVPLAFCMSGGVDSSVAHLDRQARLRLRRPRLHHRQLRRALRGAGHGRPRGARARAAPHRDPGRHRRTSCRACATLVRQHDAPVYTITYYAHWLLMEAIDGAGYRVSVSGTAADELFSGYYDHHLAYLHEVRGDAELHAALAARRGESTSRRSCAIRTCATRPVRRRPVVPRSHLPGRRGVRGVPAPAVRRGRSPRQPYTGEPAAQPHAERAVPRGGAGDPARGRPQRDVLLDREPLAVPRPRPVRVRAARSRPATCPDGKAKAVLRESMRGIVPDASSTTAARSASTRRSDFLDVDDPAVQRRAARADCPSGTSCAATPSTS